MDPTSNPHSSAADSAGSPFPGDYWGGMNSLFNPNAPPDQTFGINWDHPMFQNDGRSQSHAHGQSLYSQQPHQQQHSQHRHSQPAPQHQQNEWHQNTMQQHIVPDPQQRYSIPQDFSTIDRLQSSTSPLETSARQNPPVYHPYAFDNPNFYSNPDQNAFASSQAIDLQRVNNQSQISPDPLQPPLNSYERPIPIHRGLQVRSFSYNMFS